MTDIQAGDLYVRVNWHGTQAMRLDKTPKRVGIGKEKVLRTETWSYPMLKVKGNKEEQAKAIELMMEE